MSTPVDSFVTMSQRTQEAATTALRAWTDGMQSMAHTQSALADMPDMVVRYFDAVRRVMDSQLQFADALVGVAHSAQSATTQAARAAEGTVNAMQAAANGAASFTKAAGDQLSALTRATKI